MLAEACARIEVAMFRSLTHQVFVDVGGQRLRIQRLKSGLRYVDLEVGGTSYRVMEQNRQRKSHWAQLARKGTPVLWVFRGDDYYARWVDGKLTILTKKDADA